VATKEEIKKAILKAAGDPDTGVVKENVDAWAEAVFSLVNESSVPDKEVRIIEARETR
jgi:hypothetical protein